MNYPLRLWSHSRILFWEYSPHPVHTPHPYISLGSVSNCRIPPMNPQGCHRAQGQVSALRISHLTPGMKKHPSQITLCNWSLSLGKFPLLHESHKNNCRRVSLSFTSKPLTRPGVCPWPAAAWTRRAPWLALCGQPAACHAPGALPISLEGGASSGGNFLRARYSGDKCNRQLTVQMQ